MLGNWKDKQELEDVVQGKKNKRRKVGSSVASPALWVVVGVWGEIIAHYTIETNLSACGEWGQNQGDCISTEE